MLTPEVFVPSPARDEPGPMGQLEPEVLLRDHQGPVKDVLNGQDLPGADDKLFFSLAHFQFDKKLFFFFPLKLIVNLMKNFFSTQAHF